MPSQMQREIAQIPQTAARLLDQGQDPIRDTARALRGADPQVIVTAARGSSDCVATYFKYLCELRAGVPVASVGPSVVSVYNSALRLPGAFGLAVSQSGQSPDIVALTGACAPRNIALVNAPQSPLAQASTHVIDICAGPEKAVAATKTVLNSAIAALLLVGHWQQDDGILNAAAALPDQLHEALKTDWSALSEALTDTRSMFVLGRGPSLAMAQEAALKLKETCGLHAEAFSSGEVLHGPATLARPGHPVLGLAARDQAETLLAQVCDRLHGQGAPSWATSDQVQAATSLPCARATHSFADPLLLITSFYIFVEAHARRLGHDPDQPDHLQKVTLTQ